MREIFEMHANITEATGIKILKFGESIENLPVPFSVYQFQPFTVKSYSVAYNNRRQLMIGDVLYDLYTNDYKQYNPFVSCFSRSELHGDLFVKLESQSWEYNLITEGDRLDKLQLSVNIGYYEQLE